MNQPVHAKNMETIYYTIHSLLRLGAKSYTDQFLKSYISDSKPSLFKDDRPNILLPSQQKLVTDISIIVLTNLFKYESNIINQKFIASVERRIKKDPFIIFIQKINLNQFNDILNDSRGYSFCIKLFIYHALLKQLLLLKINTNQLAPIKLILDNYINIIQKNTTKLLTFIDTFYNSKQLEISSKLFIADVFLKDIDNNEFPVTQLISNFSQNWIRQRFSDHLNHQEYSEKNELIFSRLSNKKQLNIIKGYLEKINDIGFYFDKKCDYNLFSIFPRQIKSFHNIFITSFFDLILLTKHNTLYINIAQYFTENTKITNLYTVFGKISLELEQREKYNGLRLTVTAEFHRPPKKNNL